MWTVTDLFFYQPSLNMLPLCLQPGASDRMYPQARHPVGAKQEGTSEACEWSHTSLISAHSKVSSVNRASVSYIYSSFDSVFILKEREREWEWDREGQRERGRERIPSRLLLSAWSLMWDLNPWTMISWPELKPSVERLAGWATQAPLVFLFTDCLMAEHLQSDFCFLKSYLVG